MELHDTQTYNIWLHLLNSLITLWNYTTLKRIGDGFITFFV